MKENWEAKLLSSEEKGTKDILGIEDNIVPSSSIIGLPGHLQVW